MIQARYLSRYVLVSLICVLLLPTLSFAKSSSPEPIGRLSASASGVQWSPATSNERIALTVVAPNGAIYHKEFAAGTAPSFRLQDLGGRLTDGPYTYELRAIPNISAEVRKQLADARAAGDDDAMGRIQLAAGINANAAVQSGSLLVINGAFVSSEAEEPVSMSPAPGSNAALSSPRTIKPLDIVQADDVIIQGSLCVGLDCVNNESFGFDTIRLKENNTRIKFDDTSTASGFPNHDWQLTANDSASGGANKFSIEDITAATVPVTITGSAPSNSIFVDSSGRVGLRTSTPVLDLHLTTSNTPAHRFEQTSAGGFTAQTWDIAGNEANFFVRDVTGGSRLPFRIRPGAPTSSIDINASGNVGIGTASPASKLDSSGTMRATAQTVPTSGAGTEVEYLAAANTGTIRAYDRTGAAYKSLSLNDNITVLGGASANIGIGVSAPTSPIQHSNGATLSVGGAWTNASSRDLKQDICDLDSGEALEALKEMTPVKYAYKLDPTEHHVGFIAEDVPNLVATKDRKGLSAMDVVAVLTSVVKDQQKTIDELKARLEQIEKKQQ